MSTTAIALIASLALSALSGCGIKTDSEKSFGTASSQALDNEAEPCIEFRWPVIMFEQGWGNQSAANEQLAALEAVGLAKGEDVEIDDRIVFGRKVKTKRYTLTEAAKPFRRVIEARLLGSGGKKIERELCRGKKELDKVGKWEGPTKVGDFRQALVICTHKIERMPTEPAGPSSRQRFRASPARAGRSTASS